MTIRFEVQARMCCIGVFRTRTAHMTEQGEQHNTSDTYLCFLPCLTLHISRPIAGLKP